jgi:hypothetical protein
VHLSVALRIPSHAPGFTSSHTCDIKMIDARLFCTWEDRGEDGIERRALVWTHSLKGICV